MAGLYHDLFGGGSSQSQALNTFAKEQQQEQQQQEALKQAQAEQESEAQQLEKQRIAALRGRFGSDTTDSDISSGSTSQTTTQSSASLYAMLTGANQ